MRWFIDTRALGASRRREREGGPPERKQRLRGWLRQSGRRPCAASSTQSEDEASRTEDGKLSRCLAARLPPQACPASLKAEQSERGETPRGFVQRVDLPLSHPHREASAAHADQDETTSLPTLSRTLRLNLSGNDESSETLPMMSPVSAFSSELALRDTFHEIARQNVKYLMIVASDPLDLIYLATEARAECPNVRLVTFGAQLLYTHPDVRAGLSGMLVASSYPLVLESQAWSVSDPAATSSSTNRARRVCTTRSARSSSARSSLTPAASKRQPRG